MQERVQEVEIYFLFQLELVEQEIHLVDSGRLGEGEAASEQTGEVPVTRGTARPYEEVVNEYSGLIYKKF